MTHLAEHDSLTGLPNRLLFCDRVGQAISLAQRNGGLAAVLFLDLDGFNTSTIPWASGRRQVSQVCGQALVELCTRPDTVSRQGGDEFLILLQNVHKPEDAATSAVRVLQAVAEVHSIDNCDLYVTASIGICSLPRWRLRCGDPHQKR